MTPLIRQKDYCDNCHRNFMVETWIKRRFAYVVYTDKGIKVICCHCNREFNIFDKLPNTNVNFRR